MDPAVRRRAANLVAELEAAIQECAAQKKYLETPAQSRSTAKISSIRNQNEFPKIDRLCRIYKILKNAFDWLGNVLSESSLSGSIKESIVDCTEVLFRILQLYSNLIGKTGDEITAKCRKFINHEVKNAVEPLWGTFMSKQQLPKPYSEIEECEKRINGILESWYRKNKAQEIRSNLRKNVQRLRSQSKTDPKLFVKIADDVQLLVNYFGMQPEDDFFCELFQPVLEFIPEDADFYENFYRIRSEIECREVEKEFESGKLDESECRYFQDPNIQTVRRLFSGKKLVVIGGVPRQKTIFEKVFDCEILWKETSHSTSLNEFNAALKNPEVCAFLVLIQLSSHMHSQELNVRADEAGKPLFRVHTTNPQAIANEIVNQYAESRV